MEEINLNWTQRDKSRVMRSIFTLANFKVRILIIFDIWMLQSTLEMCIVVRFERVSLKTPVPDLCRNNIFLICNVNLARE